MLLFIDHSILKIKGFIRHENCTYTNLLFMFHFFSILETNHRALLFLYKFFICVIAYPALLVEIENVPLTTFGDHTIFYPREHTLTVTDK